MKLTIHDIKRVKAKDNKVGECFIDVDGDVYFLIWG